MNEEATILIVDDEPANQAALEALLFRDGWELVFACDGCEALRKAAAIGPDVVLLDVMMPELDGFEVCRRLRADPALAEVPVLLITALDDRASRLTGIEAGADDFVSKPYDRGELRARVGAMLKLNRYRRLVAERSRLVWVVEHAEDGYLLLDPDDRIAYVNPRAAGYLDLGAATAQARAATFVAMASQHYRLHPEGAWDGWRDLGQRDAAGSRYLFRPATETAAVLWLRVDVLDLPAAPPAGRVVRLRDVTAQLAAARDVWAFEAVIMHKLNTPLSLLLNGL